MSLITLLSMIGFGCLICSHADVSFFNNDKNSYHFTLDLIGGICLFIAFAVMKNIPLTILEGIWCLASVYGLLKLGIK